MSHRRRPVPHQVVEVVVLVAAATGLVALVRTVTTAQDLAVVFLLAVVAVAIRNGAPAAAAAAVLAVLALDFFFTAPVHHLTISQGEDLVALVVFLAVALVVARLAGLARGRAEEADRRAREATRQEAETALIAGVAASLLRGGALTGELDAVAGRVAAALGTERARLALESAPSPAPGERAVPLDLAARKAWLYLPDEGGADPEDEKRVLRGLAGVLDVALERERLAAQAAEGEAARRADVAKTAVLHAISHDLRSPLTAIRTAADGLRDPRLADADRAELVAVLDGETQRLSALVDDLLDLSRIQAGAVEPRLDWCDLGDVVARAAAPLRERRGDGSIVIELPAELPLVRADSTQLERVFSNLLDNALAHSPPERPVRVRGGLGGGWVVVRVIDEGPGVPVGQRGHVFEPFFRGRQGGPGAGLGLAICRGFVEANGGRIALQQDGGPGAAFAVRLPLVAQPAHI